MGKWTPFDPRGDELRGEIEELHRRMEQTQGELRHWREQTVSLDCALEAAKKAPPGPEFVTLLGPFPPCPTCGAGEAWRSRGCCPLGRLVGRVEGTMVAVALMSGGG